MKKSVFVFTAFIFLAFTISTAQVPDKSLTVTYSCSYENGLCELIDLDDEYHYLDEKDELTGEHRTEKNVN